MYKFQYSLSEQDYLAFNIYHAFNSPLGKKRMAIYRFVYPLAILVVGLACGMLTDEPIVAWYFRIAFGLFALCWFIFFRRIMVAFIKRNIAKIKKSGKLPYQSNTTLSFEDDSFLETTESGELKVKYAVIEHIVTNEDTIYIYMNAVQAVLLPYSVFADENDRCVFIDFLNDKRTEV